MEIYNQSAEVTSKFNNDMFINGLRSQLGSEIFKHLIRDEKAGIKVTVTMEIIEDKKGKQK